MPKSGLLALSSIAAFKSSRWPERTAAYLEGATQLFEEAATKALVHAGLTATDIDAIVTVSSTGIATPSLEVRCFGHMGFGSDTRRIPESNPKPASTQTTNRSNASGSCRKIFSCRDLFINVKINSGM